MIVEGVMTGAHRSPYHGFSVEFAQHRPYVAGDDIRHLDWKVYGRSDKLHLKQYQQETNLDLVVLVDCSGSMNYGSRSFESASGMGRTVSPDGRNYYVDTYIQWSATLVAGGRPVKQVSIVVRQDTTATELAKEVGTFDCSTGNPTSAAPC